jgi:hypothetical protein
VQTGSTSDCGQTSAKCGCGVVDTTMVKGLDKEWKRSSQPQAVQKNDDDG